MVIATDTYWPQSVVETADIKNQEMEFLSIFRQIVFRNGMRRVGELVSEELRGQAKLLEEYQDREAQQRLILAAELIQDTAEDVTSEYGI